MFGRGGGATPGPAICWPWNVLDCEGACVAVVLVLVWLGIVVVLALVLVLAADDTGAA